MKREVKDTAKFRRDYKRFRRDKSLVAELQRVIDTLANDIPLDPRFRDHDLHNNWEGCRDCHIRPDVVLIYAKTDTGIHILRLLRLGSHAELF